VKNRVPHYHEARAGFTLLELMLALAILALVLLMIMSSFSAVIHSKVQGEAHLTVDRQGRAILWELASEIRGAVQTPDPVSNVMFIGSGQAGGRVAVDAITVSTLAAGHRRAITGLDAEQLVSYSMTPNSSMRGWYVLTRSQRSGLLVDRTSSVAPPTQLADNIVSLHLKYFNGSSWLESWDSTALPPPTQLPIAVSIDLVLGTDNGHVMNFSTEVVLPMAVQIW